MLYGLWFLFYWASRSLAITAFGVKRPRASGGLAPGRRVLAAASPPPGQEGGSELLAAASSAASVAALP